MTIKDSYLALIKRMPSISEPLRPLTFKDKIKWTGLLLLLYFIMGQIMVYGVAPGQAGQLKYLEILLGSSFGSLMSLGIGPIVTASIILQLLVGSKIISWDLSTPDGKMLFQGSQKIFGILLAFIEGFIYVTMGAVPAASPNLVFLVTLQLAIGGVIVIFMDEIISKWGIGSGISLFIVAGVSKTILVRTLNPLTQAGTFPSAGNPPAGIIPFFITSLGEGQLFNAFISLLPLVATLIVFFIVIYSNSLKVEIPLAFGSIRGFGRRWPLKFFYTSNIPVILTGALLANIRLMGNLIADQAPWIATLDSNGNVTGGLLYFVTFPTGIETTGLMIMIGLFALIGAVIAYYIKKNGVKIVLGFCVIGAIVWFGGMYSIGLESLLIINPFDILRLVTYTLVLMIGSMIFSFFWMTTAGMDSKSVANQIQSIGMQIPGYRRDPRIIEKVLHRYIPALTIVGGLSVGFLAAFADFTNAIGTGTGILLATMIIYQLYEQISSQHLDDTHPAIRKFFQG